MSKEIRICREHENEIPLIWTFAFDGAEYWCPYCGQNYGMLGAGIKIEETEELKKAAKYWKKKTNQFLQAQSTLSCEAKLIKGVWVNRKDIPLTIIEKAKKIVNNFRYESDGD